MSKAFQDHFSGRSADYARFRPTYPDDLAQVLADLAPARARALDVGCGAGQLACLLAEHFELVVASDASPAQIAQATHHPRVATLAARAEASPLRDGCLDLLTAAQAAHWFDLDAFYADAQRLLRPGGLLALVSYGVTEMAGEAGALLRRFHDETLGPYWPPERRHVVTGYRELPFPFPDLDPPELCIERDWSRDALLGYVGTWSALRQAERTVGSAPFDAFAEGLRRLWPDGEPRRIRWPITLRLGRMPGTS